MERIRSVMTPWASTLRRARAVLGISGQSWKYSGEHAKALGNVVFVSDANAEIVQRLLKSGAIKATDVMVDTDISLRMQRDDSKHASYAKYLRLDTNEIETFRWSLGGRSLVWVWPKFRPSRRGRMPPLAWHIPRTFGGPWNCFVVVCIADRPASFCMQISIARATAITRTSRWPTTRRSYARP